MSDAGGGLRGVQVIVVSGVSGVGKSTITARLADRLGWEAGEGDDLHPAANIAKLSSGEPLTDADRLPWLERVAAWIGERDGPGRHGVITCSALKREYRDRLAGPGVWFVQLRGDPARIGRRMAAREGHFMPTALLASQLAILEPLAGDEQGVTVEVDAPVDVVVERILAALPHD